MSTAFNEQQKLLSIVFANWSDLTELDKKIIEIAITNPPQFMSLLGKDAIITAKTCLLRQNNKSYGEISQRLGISYKQARYACKDCGSDQAQAQRNPSEGINSIPTL